MQTLPGKHQPQSFQTACGLRKGAIPELSWSDQLQGLRRWQGVGHESPNGVPGLRKGQVSRCGGALKCKRKEMLKGKVFVQFGFQGLQAVHRREVPIRAGCRDVHENVRLRLFCPAGSINSSTDVWRVLLLSSRHCREKKLLATRACL